MIKRKKATATKRRKTGKKNDLCKRLLGADDVYLTDTKIAVRRVRCDSRGRISSDTTKYYPKTRENLSCVGKTLGRVRTGRY